MVGSLSLDGAIYRSEVVVGDMHRPFLLFTRVKECEYFCQLGLLVTSYKKGKNNKIKKTTTLIFNGSLDEWIFDGYFNLTLEDIVTVWQIDLVPSINITQALLSYQTPTSSGSPRFEISRWSWNWSQSFILRCPPFILCDLWRVNSKSHVHRIKSRANPRPTARFYGCPVGVHRTVVAPAISSCPRMEGGGVGVVLGAWLCSALQSDSSRSLPAVQLGPGTQKNTVITQVLLGMVSPDPLETTVSISRLW